MTKTRGKSGSQIRINKRDDLKLGGRRWGRLRYLGNQGRAKTREAPINTADLNGRKKWLIKKTKTANPKPSHQ